MKKSECPVSSRVQLLSHHVPFLSHLRANIRELTRVGGGRSIKLTETQFS